MNPNNSKPEFEAVGFDWDGKLKPVRDLALAPDGHVWGSYNQYDSFGTLLPWTKRTPTELAILCLRAMGRTEEPPRLPDVYVPVTWNCIPAAEALAKLVGMFEEG